MSRFEQLREQNARLQQASERRGYDLGWWHGFWMAWITVIGASAVFAGIVYLWLVR